MRRRSKSRRRRRFGYRRLANWMRANVLPLFRAGQIIVWTLRATVAQPLRAATAVLFVAMLVALPFVFSMSDGWSAAIFLVAGLALASSVAAVIANVAMRRAHRRVMSLRKLLGNKSRTLERRISRRLTEFEATASKMRQQTAEEALARQRKLEERLSNAEMRLTSVVAAVSDVAKKAAETHLDVAMARDHLAVLAADIAEGQAGHDGLYRTTKGLQLNLDKASAGLHEVEGALQRVVGATAEADVALQQLRDSNVSVDLVSALRALRLLWEKKAEVAPNEVEHGHVLLMKMLAQEAREDPSRLTNRPLIEIGTTRERDFAQGSTEKLAIFSSLLGLSFVTVDMDPRNTTRAQKLLPHLNPNSRAVTARGEDFLASCEDALWYIYLDAFDFDHGGHSEARQSRYREILHTSINDQDCWEMHAECARTISARMPSGGMVVIDDTWKDENGGLAGKGKLAVPILLANDFHIVGEVRRAVALRRG
jgi:hypothetical protein